MKQLLGLIVILGLGVAESLASDDDKGKVAEYTAFWKTTLAETSGISESVLAPLIQVNETEIRTWNAGKAFHVRYTVKMDWLTIEREDNFTVWLNESDSAYRQHGFPRDAWLSGTDLKKVIEKKINDTVIGRVDPKIKLAFTSLDEAKAFVCKENKLASLNRAEITFYVPGKLPREDGLPYLVWFAVLDEKSNKGMTGYLNLVTKAGKSWEDAVRIYAIPQGRGINPGD